VVWLQGVIVNGMFNRRADIRTYDALCKSSSVSIIGSEYSSFISTSAAAETNNRTLTDAQLFLSLCSEDEHGCSLCIIWYNIIHAASYRLHVYSYSYALDTIWPEMEIGKTRIVLFTTIICTVPTSMYRSTSCGDPKPRKPWRGHLLYK